MTTLNERLSTLHSERGHLVANYEAMLQPSLNEGRELEDHEVTALGSVSERIQSVDRQIEHFTRAEELLARTANPVPATVPGQRPGSAYALATQRQQPHVQMQRRDDYKGAGFTRWAIAMAVAGPWNAAEYARQRWNDDDLVETIQSALWMQRAATPPLTSIDGTGIAPHSALVRLEHMGSEFIELLRPQLIVARLPAMRRLQFNAAGELLIPRQTGGVSGGYVGESNSIIVQRLNFDMLRLTPSKLAVIVPITNELLHRADPGIEMMVRDDMTEGTARMIDLHFFSEVARNPNGSGAPPGIMNLIPQVPNADIPAFDPAAGARNVTAVTEALRRMIFALRGANVPMTAPVWIMHARTKEYLRLLRTEQEIFAFKAELDAGTLLGYPVVDSTNVRVPFPPGTGVQTRYALIDASQLIWAEDMVPMIDASQDASIYSESGTGAAPPVTPPVIPPAVPPNPVLQPVYSAFQNDMTFLRLRMRHTWDRRHNVAVAWALSDE